MVIQALKPKTGTVLRNVMIIDTFAGIKKGKIPVRIANIGSEDVWLNPKMRIGTAQRVEIVRETADDIKCNVEYSSNEIHVRVEKIEASVKFRNDLSDLSGHW